MRGREFAGMIFGRIGRSGRIGLADPGGDGKPEDRGQRAEVSGAKQKRL